MKTIVKLKEESEDDLAKHLREAAMGQTEERELQGFIAQGKERVPDGSS